MPGTNPCGNRQAAPADIAARTGDPRAIGGAGDGIAVERPPEPGEQQRQRQQRADQHSRASGGGAAPGGVEARQCWRLGCCHIGPAYAWKARHVDAPPAPLSCCCWLLPALIGCGGRMRRHAAAAQQGGAGRGRGQARMSRAKRWRARIDALFADDEAGETRALLVLHGGAHRRRTLWRGLWPRDTRFAGWSMTKSDHRRADRPAGFRRPAAAR